MIKRIKNILNSIYYFFPVQLFVNNLKKNQVLLIFWFLLFSIILNAFGNYLGMPYLFLDPEYSHAVSFKSLLIMGVAFGIFTISFFITSYILDSHKFSFLGTIRFPFVKFCINNSMLPSIFIVVYLYQYVHFQRDYGLKDSGDIYIECLSFLLGVLCTIFIFLIYFRYTNKSFLVGLVSDIDKTLRKKKVHAKSVMNDLYNAQKQRYKTLYFLDLKFRIRAVEQDVSYDKETLMQVIDQHHLNAMVVEVLVFILIMVMGIFKDYPIFQIPAAASGLLLFSFVFMFIGAIVYWLRAWTLTGLGLIIILFNFLISHEVIVSKYHAFGINYEGKPAEYSLNRIEELNNKHYQKDFNQTIQILENWKAKFPEGHKPKMVLSCFSGGGQRAAVWATTALQHIDHKTNHRFMKNTMLMTGASGGLIGASYYRELFLRKQQQQLQDSLNCPRFVENISTDILNPMIFSILVSDIFFRFQKFKVDDYEYYKGRGFAFEQQLNKNLEGVFDKKVRDYKEVEQQAEIPLLMMSPTVINDGRKLFISAQPVSYMALSQGTQDLQARHKGIEFGHFFEKQDAQNLTLLSALRMNATFPYVTPNIVLPTEPQMEVMDAGLFDNFGVDNASQFAYTFREWIKENTSGVVIVSIRDSKKNAEIKANKTPSVFGALLNPISGLFTNWSTTQDFSNDGAIKGLSLYFGDSLHVINFECQPIQTQSTFEKERASLSWHLTSREKEGIQQNIHNEYNQKALGKLKRLLNE